MTLHVVLVVGLLVLSIVSGMLGLGVAFAAVPFLGLFLPDLVHQVQPLSLLLNGLTAVASTLGFARGGHVDWRRAGLLATVTTTFAPAGAVLAQHVPQAWIWTVYFAAAAYMAFRLLRPVTERPGQERFGLAMGLAVPISVLSGFLVGFDAKRAAGINAFAVTPPSFSAGATPERGPIRRGPYHRAARSRCGRVVRRRPACEPARVEHSDEADLRPAHRGRDGLQAPNPDSIGGADGAQGRTLRRSVRRLHLPGQPGRAAPWRYR